MAWYRQLEMTGKVGAREILDMPSGDVEGTAVERCVESLGDTAAIYVRRHVFGSKINGELRCKVNSKQIVFEGDSVKLVL